MEKLKVGDNVYLESYHQFGKNIYYRFEKVERLTKTQAILTNGVKLINECTKDWNGNYCYSQYGDRWKKWYITTEEVIVKAEKEKYRQKINTWFSTYKFTEEEKQKIYELLK